MGDLTLIQVFSAALLGLASYIVLACWTRKPYDGWPIIGHFYEFGIQNRQDQLDWSLRAIKYHHSLPFKISIPAVISSAWMVSDAPSLKFIWSTQASRFHKAGYFEEKMRALIGKGILSVTGPIWKSQRHASLTFASPRTLSLLTEKALPGHLPLLLNSLEQVADTQNEVDLDVIIPDYIFAIFGEVGFDTKWDDIASMGQHYDRALRLLAQRFQVPGWQLWEAIFPYGRVLRDSIAEIRKMGRRIVQDVVARMREEEIGGSTTTDDRGLLIRGLIEEGLDEEIIVDSIVNFVLAGRDTTAHALVWGVYELLEQPRLIHDLRTELQTLPSGISITEIINRIPLIDHIVSEIMRLHPSVPIGVVQLQPDEHAIQLPNGATVAPKDLVFWSSWCINRLPTVFGDDAEDFRPSRWAEQERKPTAYEMTTFHAGPRSCVGQQMARMETAFVLVELLRRYDFVKTWTCRKELDEGLAGEMKGGLRVRVKRI